MHVNVFYDFNDDRHEIIYFCFVVSKAMDFNIDGNATFLNFYGAYLLMFCINEINGHGISVLHALHITFLLLMPIFFHFNGSFMSDNNL